MNTQPESLSSYTVRFTEVTCFKVRVNARSERHAIFLAKRDWYREGLLTFFAFAADTTDWHAAADKPAVALARDPPM